MPGKIDWSIYNFCCECKQKQLKTEGIMCKECKKMLRQKPRRMGKNRIEALVVRY